MGRRAHTRASRSWLALRVMMGILLASAILGARCEPRSIGDRAARPEDRPRVEQAEHERRGPPGPPPIPSVELTRGHALFESPQARPLALAQRSGLLYVANTTSGTVSVVDVRARVVLGEIIVGIDPVSVALRPDGRELWVSNHVSDSISVIDTDPRSPTRHQVVHTIQDLDERGVTRFDEPVGIAFANSRKAYVALSSRNEIAIVDIEGDLYRVRSERLSIPAQEPRDLLVAGGRLFVAAFESNNQTESSFCAFRDGTEQCTVGVAEPAPPEGAPAPAVHIVRDPLAPDRDVFVFDTRDERVIDVVSHVGTLLYGIAADRHGRVFVAHTEARNEVGGLEGGGLADLENRPFLNRVAAIDCQGSACRAGAIEQWELEPPPGWPVFEGRQLATPYAVEVAGPGRWLLVTAAGSDRVFSLDTRQGRVLGVVDVPPGPRGLAIERRGRHGRARHAYVLSTLANEVSVIDVTRPRALRKVATIAVGSDPTPPAVRRGRIAFNAARASTSGTFACASCHPDAHTDQLLWRIGPPCPKGEPDCFERIRLTQPIRGLRNSVPLHWDGSLGDPFGGVNGIVGVDGTAAPTCDLTDGDDHDCFLHLVEVSLAGPMCDQAAACPPGGTRLSAMERDDMASYLASVWHAPARSRPVDDRLSRSARDGFADFFVDQNGTRRTCASAGGCHELPLMAGTNGENTSLFGFDAPSLRGITDRFLLFSTAPNNTHEVLAFNSDPFGLLPPFDGTPPLEFPFDWETGYTERSSFASTFTVFRVVLGVGPVDIFQMLEEASTGSSGATGRQVTLNRAVLEGPDGEAAASLLGSLEEAAKRGVVELVGVATPAVGEAAALRYVPATGLYALAGEALASGSLLARAGSGELNATLTAQLPASFGAGVHRQPLLAVFGGAGPTGNPALPFPTAGPIVARGIDVREGATILVDGERVPGEVLCVRGEFEPSFCSSERVNFSLDEPLSEPGLHFVQVQNPEGPLSNELPVCVGGPAPDVCR